MPAYTKPVSKAFALRLIFCLLFFSFLKSTQGQRVFVNTIDSVYELVGDAQSCNYKVVSGICARDYGNEIYSSAAYKDRFYFISANRNDLYYTKLGSTQNCTYLTSLAAGSGPHPSRSSLNSLTADKAGLLYAGDYYTGDLYVFDHATGRKEKLGRLPVGTAGDMIFYKDKLLAACNDGNIYEVNLSDPASSTIFMNTGNYLFYGLISFPFDCQNNKIYGFAWGALGTEFLELDMENKTIGQIICNIPQLVYDAASSFETGNTLGISVDSVIIMAPCRTDQTSGNARIVATSASLGELTYTLDSDQTNNTGIFNNLDMGIHYVHISNKEGCFKDTSFSIMHGLAPDITFNKTNPLSCNVNNGSIQITSSSNYNPIYYSINNQTNQTDNWFRNLDAGPYHIKIRDGGHCESDTTIILKYQQRAIHPSISVNPTICESRSGNIQIQTNAIENIKAVSINGGIPQQQLFFDNLGDGNYLVSLFYDSLCRFDTIVTIARTYDEKPSFQITQKDQHCVENNGLIAIETPPGTLGLEFGLNDGFFSDQREYAKLQPGEYLVSVRNKNLCRWDTTIKIASYPVQYMNYTSSLIDPDCRNLGSGKINLYIFGNAAPYYLMINNAIYPANAPVNNLHPGNYNIQILNKDNCMLDTANIVLNLKIHPECNRVFLPGVFTPNGDKLNDLFRPLTSPYMNGIVFRIFNRFGQLVYSQTGNIPGWDGTFNGKPQPQGTYIWTLEYQEFDGTQKKQKGQITLVR